MKITIKFTASLLILILSAGMLFAEEQEEAKKTGFFAKIKEKIEAIEKVTNSYRVSSEGIGYTAIQDTRMAPMVYRAPGFSALMQNRTYRPKEMLLTTFFFQFSYPLYEGSLAFDETYLNPRGTIDTAYLRRIGELPLLVGGSINGSFNIRNLDALGNSSLNFDIIASVNATARWEDSFTLLKRPATWHVQAATPVYSLVVRHPLFNVSYSGNEVIWAAPWQFYRIRLNAGITRLLPRSNENSLTVDYFYDFYGLSGKNINHDLNIGLHSLTLGYALKIK